MNYMDILKGSGDPLPVYADIVKCLENLELFPYLVEKIYIDSLALGDDAPDRLRFALVRMQIYADIHRYQDMEETQKIKYVTGVLEKIIFGNLLLEHEETISAD
jgi:hypothetical protein